MNDYKELIELLAHPADGRDNADIMISAADAIEQLVKERDAAAADLRFVIASACDLDVCLWCKHREFDGQCHHDCIPYSEKWGWEWRGAKMDEVSE